MTPPPSLSSLPSFEEKSLGSKKTSRSAFGTIMVAVRSFLAPACAPNGQDKGRLRRRSCCCSVVLGLVFIVVMVHRICSLTMNNISLIADPIAFTERACPAPSYPILGSKEQPSKICLTTLTDEKKKAWHIRYFGWRNFDGLMDITWGNKAEYAEKHGYLLFDGSPLLDQSRPPSWSKIKAVQRLLKEEECDWVFWMDADAVVMNSEKGIEDFLPENPDSHFLVTIDNVSGYNAGAWLIHNSPWSLNFLETWWSMTSYIKPPGLAKSGDNDALKALLAELEQEDENFSTHVVVPPQCTFNAYAKYTMPSFLPSRNQKEGESKAEAASRSPHYLSDCCYHKGDFVAHVAGVDNKEVTVAELLQHAS